MKRVMSIFMAFLLALGCTMSAFAISADPLVADSIYAEANKVINVALQQGIVPGQSDGQISELYLSESIPLYEVTNNNTIISTSNIKYFPVIDQNNKVRGIIIATLSGNNSHVSLEYNSMLSDELTAYKQAAESICFIFDRTDIYVYNGNECTLLLNGVLPDYSRGEFNNTASLPNLERNIISVQEKFDLLSVCDPAMSGMLSVPIITQENWSNGCWAACSVSAGEYCGSSPDDITIDDVMEEYAEGQNVAKTIFTIQSVLSNEYNVDSSIKINELMMATVIDNIGTSLNAGQPVVARVSYDWWISGHFVVVCGFTSNPYPATSYVTIMDPLSSSYRTLATERVDNDSRIKYKTPSGSTEYGTDFYLTIN